MLKSLVNRPLMTQFGFYDMLGDLLYKAKKRCLYEMVGNWFGWKLICMKIHVSKKKDEDSSCIVLEIIKQFKYMYFRYFPLMLDQNYFAMLRYA